MNTNTPTEADLYALFSLLQIAEHTHEAKEALYIYMEETGTLETDRPTELMLKSYDTALASLRGLLPRAFKRAGLYMPSSLMDDLDEIRKYLQVVELLLRPAGSFSGLELDPAEQR